MGVVLMTWTSLSVGFAMERRPVVGRRFLISMTMSHRAVTSAGSRRGRPQV